MNPAEQSDDLIVSSTVHGNNLPGGITAFNIMNVQPIGDTGYELVKVETSNDSSISSHTNKVQTTSEDSISIAASASSTREPEIGSTVVNRNTMTYTNNVREPAIGSMLINGQMVPVVFSSANGIVMDKHGANIVQSNV